MKALRVLLPLKDKIQIYTYPGSMGEEEAIAVGFEPIVLEKIDGDTTPKDTEEAAKKMLETGVDLILFAGGDGTARNIYNAVGDKVPVVGIPTGVKIHSAVYANYPKAAGEVALKYLQGKEMETKEAEVMDIDEEALDLRKAKLYGI